LPAHTITTLNFNLEPTPSSTEVKGRAEQYIHTPSQS
jgi:hypothetical protein